MHDKIVSNRNVHMFVCFDSKEHATMYMEVVTVSDEQTHKETLRFPK